MNILKLIGDFNIRHANKRNENKSSRGVATVIDENTDFLVREAYNTTRTNIIYSLGSERGCKKIIITSASPHEGKTTTSLNVAITFAQTKARVLIIDADLRKPTINKYYNIESRKGLSNILSGMNTIEECIYRKSETENLYIIPSGLLPPNPSELLSSKAMIKLLEEVDKDYDYVIFAFLIKCRINNNTDTQQLKIYRT